MIEQTGLLCAVCVNVILAFPGRLHIKGSPPLAASALQHPGSLRLPPLQGPEMALTIQFLINLRFKL